MRVYYSSNGPVVGMDRLTDVEAEIEKARKRGRDDERERIVRDVEKWIENNPSGALWMLIDIIFKREPQEPKPLVKLNLIVGKLNALIDAVNEVKRDYEEIPNAK